MRVTTDQIQLARCVSIMDELLRRGWPGASKWRRTAAAKEAVGPCPMCGGTDRFSVHLRKQIFNCRQCKVGGRVIDLVMWLDGVELPEAVNRLTGGNAGDRNSASSETAAALKAAFAAGQAEIKRRAEEDDRRRQERAGVWWSEAVPIWGTLAQIYLEEVRRLELPADISPRVLRYHPACPFGAWPATAPCLLALYRDIATDEPVGVMRTALSCDATKLDRKAAGRMSKAAIKLADEPDVGEVLTIGEGLETVLSGWPLGLWPAWALGSAGAIASFPWFSGIDRLQIHVENGCEANERAVQDCADRWIGAGSRVTLIRPMAGKDLNDAVRQMAGQTQIST